MKMLAKRVSVTMVLLASLLLIIGSFQLAWADDGTFAVGSADGNLTSQMGQDNQLRAASQEKTSGDLIASDGLVGVFEITAGKASYDASTHTLTLNNVKASTVHFLKSGTIKLELIGASSAEVSDDGEYGWYKIDDNEFDDGWVPFPNCCGSVQVSGTGSLNGWTNLDGDFSISGGTVSGSICCEENITAIKGALKSDNIYCGGKLTVDEATIRAGSIDCMSMAVSAGSVKSTLAGNRIQCHGDLAISGGTVSGGIDCDGKATISGGTVSGGIHCDGKATISGGSISGGVRSGGNVTISGGTVSDGIDCKNLTTSKGKLKGEISCNGFLMAGGATIVATSIRCGNMVVKAGKVSTSGKGGICCSKSFSISGGSVTVPNSDTGICVGSYETSMHNFTVSGGTVNVSNPSNNGIKVYAGNFSMKGGTVKVTGSYGTGIYNAISVYSYQYRGKTYGGKVTVTGGSLTSTVRKPNSSMAIKADSMSNKATCLKSIVGALPSGASFTVDKITYSVKNGWPGWGYAVVSLASGNFDSLPNRVKYGKASYNLEGFSPCATRMPVGATSSWRFESSDAASPYKLKILSGTGVVSVKGKTVTALKPGTATVGLYYDNVKIAQRKVTVYALSGKYLMQSCMKGKAGMCLDMDGASKADGAQMIVWGKNGGNNQKFTFLKQKDGSYVIKSVNSGKVLDVNGASKAWGQNVIQWKANGGNNQKWRISVDASNRATFTNVNSKLVFDVEGGVANWGARMIQWGSNGGLNQKWTLVSVK